MEDAAMSHCIRTTSINGTRLKRGAAAVERPIYLIAVLGLATGMRRGEMLALRWQDIDLSAGKIRIERSF
jgi:integrase